MEHVSKLARVSRLARLATVSAVLLVGVAVFMGTDARADDPLPTNFKLTPSTTQAGAATDLSIDIERAKDLNHLRQFSLELPSGLLGVLGSVPPCPIDSAKKGDCSSDSRVGSTEVKVRTGGDQTLTFKGTIYLTSQYDGAPAGLVVVIPAVIPNDPGPAIDLGRLIVTAKVKLRPEDAGLTVVTDDLPTSMEIPAAMGGLSFPIVISSLKLNIDRGGFLINGTNCIERRAKGTFRGFPYGSHSTKPTLSTTTETSYQVTGCDKLPFRPQFSAKAGGYGFNAKGAQTGFYTEMTQQRGEATLRRVEVTLPEQIGPSMSALARACPSFASFKEDKCPSSSYVGTARVETPILPSALVGPVVLIKSASGGLEPELGLKLDGPFGVSLRLRGQVVFAQGGRHLQTVFPEIPDVPISRFALNIPGGAGGILTNKTNLCEETVPLSVRNVATSHFQISGRDPYQALAAIQLAGCSSWARSALSKGRKLKSKRLTAKCSLRAKSKSRSKKRKSHSKKEISLQEQQQGGAQSSQASVAAKRKKGKKKRATKVSCVKPSARMDIFASPPGTKLIDLRVVLPKQLRIDRKAAAEKKRLSVMTAEKQQIDSGSIRFGSRSIVISNLPIKGQATPVVTVLLKRGALRALPTKEIATKSNLQAQVQTFDSTGARHQFKTSLKIN